MRLLLCVSIFASFFLMDAAYAQKFLTRQQTKTLFNGARITHVSPRSGQSVYISFSANGTISGSSGSRFDTGKWWVNKRGAICFQFNKLLGGQRACHLLVRNGNRLVRYHVKNKQAKTGEDWIISR